MDAENNSVHSRKQHLWCFSSREGCEGWKVCVARNKLRRQARVDCHKLMTHTKEYGFLLQVIASLFSCMYKWRLDQAKLP